MLLQVTDLETGYSKKQVIFGVSLEVNKGGLGGLVALVGANGAGKTTLLHTIMGLLHPQKGTILFKGRDINKRKASENVRDGISLVPAGGRVFPDLTVLENLQLGGYLLKGLNELNQRIEFVYSLFPILKERKYQRASLMSGGERQMLAVGRALMLSPDLLLLDEPSAGLSPLLVKQLMKTVKEINEQVGTSILVVEQNIREVFAIVQKAYVMKIGKIVLQSSDPVSLVDNEELRKSYLT